MKELARFKLPSQAAEVSQPARACITDGENPSTHSRALELYPFNRIDPDSHFSYLPYSKPSSSFFSLCLHPRIGYSHSFNPLSLVS